MKNLLMSTIISCMGYTNDMLNDVPPQLQWSVLHSLPVANGHTKQAGGWTNRWRISKCVDDSRWS
jgi:hypothetical protein